MKQIYEDGTTYEGDWVNGKREGDGKLTTMKKVHTNWVKDEVYVGTFKNYIYHKYGVLTGENGSYYKGEFHEGKRQGHGE